MGNSMDILLKRPGRVGQWLRLLRLYREAFPTAERKPFGIIYRMYNRGKSDVWCLEMDGQFAGLATTINGDGLILLDYFAVVKKFRGAGVGTAAMAQLQRIYADQGLFVEIESTREEAPNRLEREKRKRFYLAAGMQELKVYAVVFGVKMELLGSRCRMDFERYQAFYRENYSQWAAKNIARDGTV